jgi:hypothetical protein
VGRGGASGRHLFLRAALVLGPQPAEYDIKYVASFLNTSGPHMSSGTAYLIARQQLTTQAVVLTLNRMF